MTKATRRSSRKRMKNRPGKPGAQTPFSVMTTNPQGVAVRSIAVNRAARRREYKDTGARLPAILKPWVRNTVANKVGAS